MAQQMYSVSPPRNFTDILEMEGQRGRPNVSVDETENPLKYVPGPLLVILGSTYCLIILAVLLVVPILELAIGAAYINQCTINPNIPVYLIVTGVCGITSIILALIIVGAFIFLFKKSSTAATVAVGVTIAVILLILSLMGLFLFIWFIVGNVWVFGAKNNVDYDDVTSPNYCHRTLYQFAFTIIILTYVMSVISCCLSCLRSFTRIFKDK